MTHLLHPRDPPSTAAGRLPMLQPGALSIVVKRFSTLLQGKRALRFISTSYLAIVAFVAVVLLWCSHDITYACVTLAYYSVS